MQLILNDEDGSIIQKLKELGANDEQTQRRLILDALDEFEIKCGEKGMREWHELTKLIADGKVLEYIYGKKKNPASDGRGVI